MISSCHYSNKKKANKNIKYPISKLLQHSAFLIALGFLPRRPDASNSVPMVFVTFGFVEVTKSSCRGKRKENQNMSCCDQPILEELKSI